MKKITTIFIFWVFTFNGYGQQYSSINFVEIPELNIIYGTDEPTIYDDEQGQSLSAQAAFQIASSSKDKIFKTITLTRDYPGQLNDFDVNANGQILVQCLPCSTCVCFSTGRALKREIAVEFEQGTIISSDLAVVSPVQDLVCQIRLTGNIERIDPSTDKFLPLPGWGGVQIFYGAPRVQEFGAPGNYVIDCFPQPSLCAKFVW